MKRLTLLLTLLLLSLTACAGAASSAEATPTAVPTPIVAQKPTYSVALGTVAPISTIGFGLMAVSSDRRVPKPPARITAFTLPS